MLNSEFSNSCLCVCEFVFMSIIYTQNVNANAKINYIPSFSFAAIFHIIYDKRVQKAEHGPELIANDW